MSNAFDGAVGQRGSDTVERTSVDTGLGSRAVSLDDGLLGLESNDGAGDDVGGPVSTIAGVGGIVATGVVALGTWASLWGSPAGWAVLGLGLLVGAAFGRRTRRSLATGAST